jgi:hypothetical protein
VPESLGVEDWPRRSCGSVNAQLAHAGWRSTWSPQVRGALPAVERACAARCSAQAQSVRKLRGAYD